MEGDLDLPDYGNYTTLLLFVFLSSIFVLLLVPFYAQRKNKRPPPGPFGLPLIGHLHLLGKRLHLDLHKISQKYGPIVLLRFGSHPTVVASSPQMAMEFLKNHDRVFLSRPSTLATRLLLQNTITFSDYGEHSRQMKKLLSLEVLTSKRLENSQHIRAAAISDMICTIKQEGKEGKEINMSKIIKTMAFNIITTMAMGMNLCGIDTVQATQFGDLTREATILAGAVVASDIIPQLWWLDFFYGFKDKLKKLHIKFDLFLDNILQEHRHRKGTNDGEHVGDFIDALLNHELNLEDDKIKGIIQDVLAAGSETTSSALEWTLSELLLNPSILKQAQDELDVTLGDHGVLDESCLNNLKYLKAIVKESLRLHPPGPLLVPHQATEDCVVAGYNISKGTRLLVNVWAISRDPSAWERPLNFDPQRFLESSIDVRGQDFATLPFGAGRRACPGMNLAIRTLEIALAHLLHSFDWNLAKEDALDMEENNGLTLSRATLLRAVAIPRNFKT